MILRMRDASCFLLLLLLMRTAGGAQQAPVQRAERTLNEGVTAVLVDVVVRDKRGQPVRDLTAADFELLEDGVSQSIASFSAFAPASAAGTPTTVMAPSAPDAGGASPPVNAGPAVTALVFDRLTPEARALAVQAAQAYLGTKEETSNYIGIFGIDMALTPYAPFTRNAVRLRKALSDVAGRASASFNGSEARQQKADADQQAAAAEQTMAGAAAAGPGASAAMGTAPGDALLAQMQSKMIQDFDVMERDQQGYATTNGLFAVIRTLGRLPGRKSLVLFSEGISIPPPVQRLFVGVIDAANRANVSVYTMDAAGLRGVSEQAKIRDEVNQAGARGINSAYATPSGDDPLTKALENNEAVLRQDPHTGLGELAEGTGGVLFENTNNLRHGFDRIDDDLHNYYLLGYTPLNETYDGRFRRIDVKVKRPGLTVAARQGYFAVRSRGDVPLAPWEAPAMAAIDRRPVPNAFPVRAGALLFPARGRPGLVPVVVDLQTAPLTFAPAADGKTYSSDFVVMVRFLDSQNQVARKVSQHYDVNGPLSALERAKQGEVIFYREPELPPGVYTMETVVYDAPSGKSSVRLSTVEVPKAEPDALRMSSLVVVKRTEKIPEKERRSDNPLLVKDLILYPNFGDAISKSAKEVGFYFAAYPAKGGPAPESVLELLADGKALAQVPIALGPADASGRIQQVGRLPVDQLQPGTYELRAIVKQGATQVARSAMLRIVE
jgi:VWFA-related protein